MSNSTQLIFFASNAKPSSMRRALAYRLAEEFPVVLITEPHSFLRERTLPALVNRIITPAGLPNLREFTPIHFPSRLPVAGQWLQRLGRRMLAAELDQLLASYGEARRIVCYDSPSQHHLVGRLGEHLSVYLAIDNRTVTVWGEPIPGEAKDELELLTKIDRVICVSEPLAATLRAKVPAGRDVPINVLTNGYDERLFDPGKIWVQPSEISALPRPRILVTGHVSKRIDWEGIRDAAAIRPAWVWIFVGPADENMATHLNTISSATGALMKLYPPIPHEAIPAWIAHCDVCAVPYCLNSFTIASSPLKAIEYLGSGAPILSTPIPSMTSFGDAIEWVREADGASYVSALDALIKDGRSATAIKQRCSAVSAHTWAHKARLFCNFLEAA